MGKKLSLMEVFLDQFPEWWHLHYFLSIKYSKNSKCNVFIYFYKMCSYGSSVTKRGMMEFQHTLNPNIESEFTYI